MVTMKSLIAMLKTAAPTSTPRSAEDLRRDLAEIDLPQLRAQVARIEADRKDLLLSASDDALAANAAALAGARLMVERAEALTEVLQKKLAEAEQREKAAELEAEHEDAKREAEKLKSTYIEIDKLAATLGELLRESSQSCVTLHRWNTKAPDRRVVVVPVEIVKRRLLGVVQ
jgi:hypothetical protein